MRLFLFQHLGSKGSLDSTHMFSLLRPLCSAPPEPVGARSLSSIQLLRASSSPAGCVCVTVSNISSKRKEGSQTRSREKESGSLPASGNWNRNPRVPAWYLERAGIKMWWKEAMELHVVHLPEESAEHGGRLGGMEESGPKEAL